MLPWVFFIMPLSLNGNEGQINGSTGGLVHNIGVDMHTGCVRYGSVQFGLTLNGKPIIWIQDRVHHYQNTRNKILAIVAIVTPHVPTHL